MEPGNEEDKVVDLSQALDQADPNTDDIRAEETSYTQEDMRGLYKLVAKLSGGMIKTKKQAQAILVILIILVNIITLSLVLNGNSESAEDNQANYTSGQAG